MAESHRVRRTWLRGLLVAGFSVGLMLISGHPSYYAAESQFPHGRLVRMDALPPMDPEMCLIPAAVQRAERASAVVAQRQRGGLALGPETTIIAGNPMSSAAAATPCAWLPEE